MRRAPLQFSSFFSDDACDLITRLLERDPRRRITVAQAKEHRCVARRVCNVPPCCLAMRRMRSLCLYCRCERARGLGLIVHAAALCSVLLYAVWCGRFFDMVDWGRMEARDYKPPMVPSLAHDLDLSFFDPTFTAEPPCVPTRLTGPHAVAHTRIRTRAHAHAHTRTHGEQRQGT